MSGNDGTPDPSENYAQGDTPISNTPECQYCVDNPATLRCLHDFVVSKTEDSSKPVETCEDCHEVWWGGRTCDLDVTKLPQPHPSNTEQTLDDMIIEVRHGRMSNTKAKAIIATHTAEAVRAVLERLLERSREYGVSDAEMYEHQHRDEPDQEMIPAETVQEELRNASKDSL